MKRITICPTCQTKVHYSWGNGSNWHTKVKCPSCNCTFSAPQKRGRKPKMTKSNIISVVRYINLECIDRAKNHYKFFDIFVMSDFSVITVNGRIGTAGIVRPYRFGTANQADQWSLIKEDEKRNLKNYVDVRGQPRTAPPGYPTGGYPTGGYPNSQPVKQIKERVSTDFDAQDYSDPVLAQVIFDILQNPDIKSLTKSKKVDKVKEDIASLGMKEDSTKVEELIGKIISKK